MRWAAPILSFCTGCTWIYGNITRQEMGSTTAPSTPTLFSVQTKSAENRFYSVVLGPIASPTFNVSPVSVGHVVRMYSDSACTTLLASSSAASGTSVNIDAPTISSYGLQTYYFKSYDPSSGLSSGCSSSGLSYAYARSFTVNDLVDTNRADTSAGDGVCLNASGFCSLFAAHQEAAAWPSETYFFLELVAGTHPLTASLTIGGMFKVFALYGSGTQPVIDGQTYGRTLGNVNLTTFVAKNIRFTRLGTTPGQSALFTGCSVYFKNVQLDDNRNNNNSIALIGYGGVLQSQSFGVESSTISGNLAAGGWDLVRTARLNFYDVTYTNNALTVLAKNTSGESSVENSTFLNNTTSATRLIDLWDATNGSFRVSSSLFSGNSGTIISMTPTVGNYEVSVINTTFSNNARDGIYFVSGFNDTLNVLNSTFWQSATTSGASIRFGSGDPIVNIRNSIIAVNNGARNNCTVVTGTPVINISDSLIDDNTCGTGGGGNLFAIAPDLGALALNGGTTLNHLPNPSSPVRNAGNNSTCQTTDQRGVARPIGGRCDMGAVESP